MLSFHQAMNLQYELLGRYPASELIDPSPRQSRSAMQINLDVRRAQRSGTLGR